MMTTHCSDAQATVSVLFPIAQVHAGTIASPFNRGLAPAGTCRPASRCKPDSRLGSLCADSKLPHKHVRTALLPRARWCGRTTERCSTNAGICAHTARASTAAACCSPEASIIVEQDSNLQDEVCLQQPCKQPNSRKQQQSSWTDPSSCSAAVASSKTQVPTGRPPAANQQSSAVPKAAAAAAGAAVQHQPTARLRNSSGFCTQHQQQQALSSSQPPAPWGLAGARGLPLPRKYCNCHIASTSHSIRSSRRDAVRLGAFVGSAAATAPGSSWHQALG